MSLRRISLSTLFMSASIIFVLAGTAWVGFALYRLLTEPSLDAAQTLPEPLFTLSLGILGQRGAQARRQRERLFGVLARPFGAIERKQDRRIIQRALLLTRGQTPRVAIVGLAGTGKTTLALQIIYRDRIVNRFRDGILWLQVDRLPDTRAILRKIAQHVTKSDLDPRQTNEEYAIDLRAALGGKRALVILDDLPPKMISDPDLDLLLNMPCAILITSQYQELGLEGTKVTLAALSRKEWLALLTRKLASRPGVLQEWMGRLPILPMLLAWRRMRTQDRAAANRIWSAVEGLPLALNIVASDLASGLQRDIAAYATDLEERRDKLEKLHQGERKNLSVRISLDASYDRLEDRDPERFTLLAMRNGPDLPLPFVAALWGMGETDTLRNLKRLKWRSLLEPSGEERWRLHSLVREYANRRLTDWQTAKVEAGGRLAGYYASYVREHIEPEPAALEVEWADLQHAVNWATSAHNDSAAIQLALLTRPFFDWRRDWSTKCSWLTSALEPARRSSSLDERLDLLDALGELYMSSGACGKAQNCYQEAVDVSESATGQIEEMRLGRTLKRLGEVNTWLGLYSEALTSYSKAETVYQQLQDEIGQSQVLSRIFRLLALQRKDEEATSLFHSRYARLLSRMLADCVEGADVLLDQGIAAEIEANYREAQLKYNEGIQLSADLGHLNGLVDGHRLRGRLSLRTGDYPQARASYWEAASISRLGHDPLGHVRMLEELGHFARSEHQLHKAEWYWGRVWPWCTPRSDGGKPKESLEAVRGCTEAPEWREFVDYRPGWVHVLGAEGELKYVEGDLVGAEARLAEALRDYGKWGVEEPWWQVQAMYRLARVEELRGKLAAAQKLYQKAAEVYGQLQQSWWQAEATYHGARLAQMRGDLPEGRGESPDLKAEHLAEAKAAYQASSGVFGSLKYWWWQGELACQAASIAERLGALGEACRWYGLAADAYEREKAASWQARAGLRAAQTAELAGDLDCARNWYRASACAFRRANEPWNESEALYRTACLAERLVLASEARVWYQRASKLYNDLGALEWQVEAAYRSARLAEGSGSYSEANQWYQAAATTYQQMGEPWRQAEALYRAARLGQDLQSRATTEEAHGYESDALPEVPEPAFQPRSIELSCLAEEAKQCRWDAEGFANLRKPWGQAEASFRAAGLAELQGSTADAAKWYQEASEIYRELKVTQWQAETSLRTARLTERLDDCIAAEQWYERALQSYQGFEEKWKSVDVIAEIARLMERRQCIEKAIAWYERMSNYCAQLGQPNWQAAASLQAARLAEQVRDLPTSSKHYEAAAEACHTSRNVLLQTEATWRAARLAERSGNLVEAVEGYRRVSDLYQELKDAWRQAETLYRAAYAAERLYRLSEAKAQYQRALGLFQETGEPWWEAEVTYQIAWLADLLGQLQEAQDKYTRALRMYEKTLHDEPGETRALCRLGSLAIIQENYPKADSCLGRAQQKCTHATDPDPHLELMVQLALADLALAKGSPVQADSQFQVALAKAEFEGLIPEQAEALLGCGRAAAARGDLSKAVENLTKSVSMCETSKDQARQVRVLNAFGEIVLQQNNYSEARKYSDRALALSQESKMLVEMARALATCGQVDIAEAHYSSAAVSLEAARKLFRQLGLQRKEAGVLSRLGRAAVEQQDYGQAEKWLGDALVLYMQLKAIKEQVDTLLQLAEVAQALQDTPLAIERYESAVQVYEDQEDIEGALDVCYRFATIQECYGQFDLAADYCLEALGRAARAGLLPPMSVHHSLRRIEQAMGEERFADWRKSHQAQLSAYNVF